ncbi:bifunctional tRNA (5-methylaminomethyl-2-thiouridine)(34)-methyltransferase MnmD/FAD-dependent 5-carboxymethylaminomethyl-2-thiouridine(34) oxidoreductase MnmC [Fastidiosibacter lacustris]|uniref:bifunctional tRNA (5-methylaminomethyl-2-thiouridine)(34)-methyltransferase MnmD/FAD-dependent 5-carboxymethylaminomethyl-2-thiouridine(34) oxidoreductase MnmC n=1 Tax=Fastidiosibacter lacustris TaxID=2056695 RepID=UPI00130076D3|nr:bifunctional tRNA (5-methylaminomethyl-2-thiouridine)(34)-methyltransferase MnmD/FAD-dependent 5-carboxymethylaminomethyl-2-thiouridine(34) oxidoreductase MnmC [Fastidiosibacter lacustris]
MQYAKLSWQATGEPISSEFGDVYFSKSNGLAESKYVFLQGNRLRERFENLTDNAHFIVAETGFGTGLNFLALVSLWHKVAPKSAKLTFISCEKYPLTRSDLIQSLSLWSSLEQEKRSLIASYPEIFYTGQTLLTIAENISLNLLIGDAAMSLAKIDTSVDAWFLDGFAPSKNPDMWSDALFSETYRLSHAKTTLATFSAAGFVKRALENNGFQVKKQKGFAYKREMLTATVKDIHKNPINRIKPYFSKPYVKTNKNNPIAVIGAGMAGCAVAYELTQKGYEVHLYEQKKDIAQAASGNPYGILKPYLTADANVSDIFHTQGFLSTREYILKHQAKIDFIECGALELLSDDKSYLRFSNIVKKRAVDPRILRLVDKTYASEIASINIEYPCAYYPTAMMVNPYSLCKALMNHASEKLQLFLEHKLKYCLKNGNKWQLVFEQKTNYYQQVIFAGNASLINTLEILQKLKVYPSYGQITLLKPALANKTILLDKGYFLPIHNNVQLIGASFRDNIDLAGDRRNEDDQSNILQLQNVFKNSDDVSLEIITNRVGLRCVTSDHVPIIGALASYDEFYQQYYHKLQKGMILKALPEPQYLTGLYVLSAFGSKGLCSMIYGSKILACLIENGRHFALANHLLEALHPLRFWVRELKQR